MPGGKSSAVCTTWGCESPDQEPFFASPRQWRGVVHFAPLVTVYLFVSFYLCTAARKTAGEKVPFFNVCMALILFLAHCRNVNNRNRVPSEDMAYATCPLVKATQWHNLFHKRQHNLPWDSLKIFLYVTTSSSLISQNITYQTGRMIEIQLQHCSLQLYLDHPLKTEFIVCQTDSTGGSVVLGHDIPNLAD